MHIFETKQYSLAAFTLVLGFALGSLFGGLWPNVPLHATATQGQDNFAIATGLVEQGLEGIYFLDFLTGDLMAAVIQPRAGKFNAFFKYNILNDFASAAGKNPKFLMVTGEVNMPRGRASTQFANSVIYIAEASTGELAAYVMPWNTTKQAAGQPQSGTFIPLDKRRFRTAPIRE